MTIQPGTRLGPYEIAAAIGAGGMGEVYRARDTRLGRDVAIKTLPTSLAADPERLARFRREAETLAALNHPHIATIFGLEQLDGVLALVMELVEGPTLAERIAHGSMSIDEALPLAKELTLALEAAHDRGIIHRDLKPANIKLTTGGSIKLLDFGLAKALDAGTGESGGPGRPSGLTASPTMSVMATQAGVLLGTAAYMSPEQVRGAAVDKRADIWAFGVVLFEMLTGCGMFGGETISDTLAGVLREPIDLNRVPPETPRSIRQLLARCLERNPKQRLRDIGEARIAIENHLANPSVDAVDAGATSVRASTWRTAAPWALSAVLIVALGAVALRRAASTPTASPEAAAFALDLGVLSPARGGNTGGFVAVSADGRRIVIAARSESGSCSAQRLYQRTLNRPEFTAVPGTEESANPFVSPDGQWVGFESHGQLKKVSFAGGVPIPICDLASSLGGATWLDDGTIIFSSQNQLFQVPAAGGKVEVLWKPGSPEDRYVWPAAVPGGHAVLFTVRSFSRAHARFRIAVLDLTTRQEHAVADAGSAPKYMKGFVLYAQQAVDEAVNPFAGRVLAVPFDSSRFVATGPPVTVLEDALVFSGGAANYDVAPNGTSVFFSRAIASGARDLAWFSAPTEPSGAGTVAALKGTSGAVTLARLSRDDRTVLMQVGFSGVGTLYTYSVERGSMGRVPFEGDASNPILGPGDGMLTFSGGAQRGLFAAPLDGSKPAEQLTTAVRQQIPGSWSRDGATLVFTEFNGGIGDVLALKRGEHDPKPLVATAADERTPVLSPDDRWIAYASNESGRYEIYVRSSAGSGGRYTVSADGGELPVWSRNGRRLFYVHDDTNLMGVDVVANPTFSATPPRLAAVSNYLTARTLGSRAPVARSFDIAQDGRLLVVRSIDNAPEGATARVILNLHEAIRLRAPTVAQ